MFARVHIAKAFFAPLRGGADTGQAGQFGKRLDSMTPVETAWRVKVATLWMLSFIMRPQRCFSAVFLLMHSNAAICLVQYPSAINWSTSA